MVNNKVFVAGASGYIGKNLVNALHKKGYQVSCLARHLRKETLPCTRFIKGNILNPTPWKTTLKEHNTIVNLVGIIKENPKTNQVYPKVHVEGTLKLIEAAREMDVKRYIHISALGVEQQVTPYQQTKFLAESAVKESNLDWTIFKPSMVLGRNDNVVPMLMTLMKFLRIIPCFKGNAKEFNLQPVFIDDLITGILKSIENPLSYRKTFEVAGPDRVTYCELLTLVSKKIPGPVALVPVPFGFAKKIFTLIEKTKVSPITTEQLELLKLGSVSDNWEEFYRFFGITPTPLKDYLGA